jgi:hypothetical protein
MIRPLQSFCPHCARPLDAVEKITRDHVVPRSMGGHETVPACKRCNDAIAASFEARLVSTTGLFTILSQVAGLTPGVVQAQTEEGRSVRWHFGEKGHQSATPDHRIVEQTDHATRVEAFVPTQLFDSYLAHLAKRYNGEPTITNRSPAPPTWQSAQLSASISDLRRLNARIALNTGALRWGDDFLLSPLADWLRVVLDVWSDWPDDHRPDPLADAEAGGNWPMTVEERDEVLRGFEQAINPVLASRVRGDDVSTITPGVAVTCFASAVDPPHTLVYSIVLGMPLPALTAPQTLPVAFPDPILVVHRGGPPLVSPRNDTGGGIARSPE